MFGKEKKPKRFVVREDQSLGLSSLTVVVDTQTGVHYLAIANAGGGSSITPLLDENGKIFIDKTFKEQDADSPWG